MDSKIAQSTTEKIKLLDYDPWLAPYERDLRLRQQRFIEEKFRFTKNHGSIANYASGHHYFGIHKTEAGFVYREWAPSADQLFFMGDFNNWNRTSHPMTRVPNGGWEITLPYQDYSSTFVHESCVKVHVIGGGVSRDRIPLYINRVLQDPRTANFAGQVWFPKEPFVWTDKAYSVKNDEPLFIYECHVGMAQEKEGLGTYREFAEIVLPRVVKMGYNAIQLMAIQEHPYYGSFGYHVSNFFAASSRFGTPEDLKFLINAAHEQGVAVLLDIVHSHAVKNVLEGINEFDGTQHQFFHSGPKGEHSAWDSKLFDYGRAGVVHFLLSNVRYWLEEYHFDGFRFDGVTSMIYHHHGLGHAFDHYDKYFSTDTDVDAILYLQLANALAKEIKPGAITIAEDMSGMPGMCVPINEGGIGFDYRLGMGIPDFWIKTLRSSRDEEWNLTGMWHELSTRRPHEKSVGYCESHDQALVGDKTIAFWLMDAAMYWFMREEDKNIVIDRGIALHKMIRLVTFALGSDAYLNFIGNEFGHPEWIDFPREGNNWSYKYARRQWSLADDPKLKFKYLLHFDSEMLRLGREYRIPFATDLEQLWLCNDRKLLIFKKAGLLFAFNFHSSYSLTDFEIFTCQPGKYKLRLSSDASDFGGFSRLASDTVYETTHRPDAWPPYSLKLYLPCRTAFVLELVE